MVDGKPFPWLITESGPSVRKLGSDCYLVRVEIFVATSSGDTRPETFYHQADGASPVILGQEFPWPISEDGFEYHSGGSTEIPTVTLEFFARSAEGIFHKGKLRDATGHEPS